MAQYRPHKQKVAHRRVFRRRVPVGSPVLPRPEAKYLTSLLNQAWKIDLPERGSFNAGIADLGNGDLFCVYRPSEYAFISCILRDGHVAENFQSLGISNCADPRLLWVKPDELWMIYSSTDERVERIRGAVLLKQNARLTNIETFWASPPLTSRQKNWLPFMYDGRLFLVASVCPHIIYELDLETKECRQVYETPWIHPWFNKEHLRGSTNIVQLDDGNYLGTFHTARAAGPMHTLYYDNGCYVFEGKPPFRVLRCSNRTYLKAEDAVEPHFRKAGLIRVCFPCGTVRRGQELLISYGDNDSAVKIMTTTVHEMLHTTLPVYSG